MKSILRLLSVIALVVGFILIEIYTHIVISGICAGALITLFIIYCYLTIQFRKENKDR